MLTVAATPDIHGLASLPVTVPNSTPLIGLTLYSQALTFDTMTGAAALTGAGMRWIQR